MRTKSARIAGVSCLASLLSAAACGDSPSIRSDAPVPASRAPATADPSTTALASLSFSGTGSPGVTDHKSLVEHLRSSGLAADEVGVTEEFLFPTRSRGLIVNSGSIEAFEYPDLASTDADVAKVSADGLKIEVSSNDGKVVTDLTWVARPHLYRNGKLIVLYAGDNVAIIAE